MNQSHSQYLRKVSLLLAGTSKALDLSELRVQFTVLTADFSSPNHAVIRVYNPSQETVVKAKEEYNRVVLQAGYRDSVFGVIFEGTIKQIRSGKLDTITSFMDILAADGDIGYNFGICNATFAAGSDQSQHIEEAARAMGLQLPDLTGVNPASLPRGKVAFGMARDIMQAASATLGATWSIQNGQVQVIPMQGYQRGDVVEINSATGMVGIPEQTDEGVRVRTLLNPKLRIGNTVKLNNKEIVKLTFKDPFENSIGAGIAFNSYTGITFASKLAEGADGIYRLYVVEHSGDTRGQEWYSDLVCLAINQASNRVEARN